MGLIKTTTLILFIALIPVLSYADEVIIDFDEKWAVNVSGIFSNMLFREETGNYTADSPLALGLGFNYKGTSISLAIPITLNYYETILNAINFQLTSYNNILYYEAFLKQYTGFRRYEILDESVITELDLRILYAGLTVGWLLNGENHSLSAVYELDKKQLVSNGSFIVGFDINYMSIISNDITIERYNINRPYLYTGPNFGYSYTFVFPTDAFLNLNFIGGIDVGMDIDSGEWLFIPQIKPKVAFGYHFRTWSFNVTGSNILTFIFWDTDTIDMLMPTTIALTFSKRF